MTETDLTARAERIATLLAGVITEAPLFNETFHTAVAMSFRVPHAPPEDQQQALAKAWTAYNQAAATLAEMIAAHPAVRTDDDARAALTTARDRLVDRTGPAVRAAMAVRRSAPPTYALVGDMLVLGLDHQTNALAGAVDLAGLRPLPAEPDDSERARLDARLRRLAEQAQQHRRFLDHPPFLPDQPPGLPAA